MLQCQVLMEGAGGDGDMAVDLDVMLTSRDWDTSLHAGLWKLLRKNCGDKVTTSPEEDADVA
jgi:hypothetical protein